MILANTVGFVLTMSGVRNFEQFWQLTTIMTFAIVQGTWAVALWKAAPEKEQRPTLLSASIYARLSPEINDRLTVLNAQLMQFWKPEVTRH